jgi:replication factor A1
VVGAVQSVSFCFLHVLPDVIGVVKEVGPLSAITSKATNRTVSQIDPPISYLEVLIRLKIPKRDLTIVDMSQYSVRLTLWGKQAEQFSADDLPVVAFKGVKVGDFGGMNFSCAS